MSSTPSIITIINGPLNQKLAQQHGMQFFGTLPALKLRNHHTTTHHPLTLASHTTA
jgi:hypothetical protein